MKAPLVFVHGWGFDASIWEGIKIFFPDTEMTGLDLGFMGEPVDGPLVIRDNAIIVAHSLGVMWSLKHLPRSPRALISICGFDRFSPPVPRKNIALMKRGLMKNPGAQMSHFWRSCGIAPFTDEEQLNRQALLDGLTWLMDWDARPALANIDCPVYVLAAHNDEVVPEEMSSAIWGNEQIIWSDTGGHALPLTRPRWCAEQIRPFIERNE